MVIIKKMENFIYSNLSEQFFLLDYSASHRQLVIRSKRNMHRSHNVDILFKGILNLFVPENLNGISISLRGTIENNMPEMLLNCGFREDNDYKIYLLKDLDDKTFYINATSFGIFHSKIDILQTIIGRYDMGNFKEERVLWHK